MNILTKTADIFTKAAGVFRAPTQGILSVFMPRTKFDYAAEVQPMANSALSAVVNWYARTFPEAPLAVFRDTEDGETEIDHAHELPRLVRHPNPFYSGSVLWMATVIEMLIHGNAYWWKIRNNGGRVAQLWPIPAHYIEPKWPNYDSTVFLSHYDYRVGGGGVQIDPQDIVHFRWGIDPENVRKGRSPITALLREIFTDDEAANFTAALLRNMGVPGYLLSPDGDGGVDEKTANRIREKWQNLFTGDNRGRVLVAGGKTKVDKLGFNPQEMDLARLRAIPEERITANLGIPAAVVGLGSGLETTKVGATLREYREQAYESGIIPLQRLISEQVDLQLGPDFRMGNAEHAAFDLRGVRVLQEDENAKWKRYGDALARGGITRAQFLRGVGLHAGPADEVFLLPVGVLPVPAGELPESLPPADTEETRAASEYLRGLTSGNRETVTA